MFLLFYLTEKSCPKRLPPRNGALACTTSASPACAVFCKSGTDFEFNPPMLYYCSSGKWETYSLFGIGDKNIPNCSGKRNAIFTKCYTLVNFVSLNHTKISRLFSFAFRQPATCLFMVSFFFFFFFFFFTAVHTCAEVTRDRGLRITKLLKCADVLSVNATKIALTNALPLN